jgi:caffeoyl-CoA O-methyltransferase
MKHEYFEIGRPIIEKAGMAHKVDFREGPALSILDQLVSEVTPNSTSSSYLAIF